jgi:hypothetical protein
MNISKFILNLSLTIVMLLLMDPRSFYGISFHEWAGLFIGLFFILHKILNWTWISKVTVSFFKKCTGRSRLNYVLDVLLLAGMILMILSGIAIARTINFSWLHLGGSPMFWRVMHTSSSLITLVLFGIHLGLHWNWVLQRLHIKNLQIFKKIILATIALAVVISGYIGITRLNYWQRSVNIFSINSSQSFAGRGGRSFEGGMAGRRSSEGREGFQRPDSRQIPDSIRSRFEAQGGRPPMSGNRNFPDSLRQRNSRNFQGQPRQGQDGAVQNFNRRPQTGAFEGGPGRDRGGFPGGKKVNLRSVWWFLAVFAAFTSITIYADKTYNLFRKKVAKE